MWDGFRGTVRVSARRRDKGLMARIELEEMVREELTLWKAEQRQAALLRFQPGFDPAAPVPPLTPSTSVELALKVFDGGVGGGTCVPH